MLAAHDAGEAERLHARRQTSSRSGSSVSTWPLSSVSVSPGTREAHDDIAFEQPVVVRVQRLAQLEHHVVGDVDDCGDRTNARSARAALHPRRRRRTRVDAVDRRAPRNAGRPAASSIRTSRVVGVRDRRHAASGQRQRRAGDRGDFARDAGERQAIGTIGRELDREQRIVERERLAEIPPAGASAAARGARSRRRTIRARAPSTACPCDSTPRIVARRIALAAGQLRAFERAWHAHAGRGVRRAADDLQQLARADVDRAHPQPVGVRVRRNADDLADDDARERRRGGRDVLDLEARHRQRVAQRGGVDRRIDERAQPVFGEFHASLRELPQEAQVVLEEQAQVVDAVAQHRQPIGSHAEREALLALGIDARPRAARSDAPGPQPAISSQPPSPKRMSISADGSVNGKNDGRKRTFMSSRSKKLRRNSVNTPFRSANVTSLVDPQAFDLVEHRRMRRIAVDAVHAARRDDLDRRRMRFHVADLDRRRVRAQHMPPLDVERVVHRARRMVLGRVERGEVVVVVFDLGTVGDVEAERAEQRLDALERARDRMQAADAAPAAGQRHVERFGGELRFELRVGERLRGARRAPLRAASSPR